MKKIVLLGAPGAGKGTQAALITQKFGIPQISTGDILRRNIKEATDLGLAAKSCIDKGALVPDDVVIGLVKARLDEEDARNGYVLDGFPRTIAQAEALDKITSLDIALNIIAPYELIMKRLTGRRVCICGATSHVDWLNGSEVCPKCGKTLFIRDDDKPETVKARLEVYEKQTAPLIDYYKNKGILIDIDSRGTAEDIFVDVEKVLK